MIPRKIVRKYILAILDLQETRLKCINLGFNKSEEIKAELYLIEEAKKFIKRKGEKESGNMDKNSK